jgi:predicted small metal-binding protein
MLTLACRDAGVECDYIAKGETEEDLWTACTEHVVKDHGFKREDISEDFKSSHRSMIKGT